MYLSFEKNCNNSFKFKISHSKMCERERESCSNTKTLFYPQSLCAQQNNNKRKRKELPLPLWHTLVILALRSRDRQASCAHIPSYVGIHKDVHVLSNTGTHTNEINKAPHFSQGSRNNIDFSQDKVLSLFMVHNPWPISWTPYSSRLTLLWTATALADPSHTYFSLTLLSLLQHKVLCPSWSHNPFSPK